MNSEFEKWHKIIMEKLAASAPSFNELYDILIEIKKDNLGKEFAYNLFKDIRSSHKENLSEEKDDLLLEIMDVISGYCLPSLIVWT